MNRAAFILAILAALATLWLALPLRAQATQPVEVAPSGTPPPPQWMQAVLDLSKARTAEALQRLLSTDCVIRRFGADHPDDDSQLLLSFIIGRDVLGEHAYLHPPLTMAQDIAADVNASGRVSDDVKRAMTPDGPESRRTADAVAARWVSLNLNADEGTAVGVIVLWSQDEPTNGPRRPSSMLVRGQASDDGYKITTIVYGDPLQ